MSKSVFQLAAFYITNAPSAEFERLAFIHHHFGIADVHYDRWLDAFVETVKEQDSDCDLAIEVAGR